MSSIDDHELMDETHRHTEDDRVTEALHTVMIILISVATHCD
jgi:hypothetical protein